MKPSSGNMYKFITHTWNPVRGKCPYNCKYCYTEQWGKLPPLYLNEKVLREDLGKNNFIFICSGCDLFHPDVPDDWIYKTIEHSLAYNNKYLLHTKNPERALLFQDMTAKNHILCVTVESDIDHGLSLAPPPAARLASMKKWNRKKMLTVEPVLKFAPARFADAIMDLDLLQVNIGADSKSHSLPEPSPQDIEWFIELLSRKVKVVQKPNLRRLYKGGDYDR